MKVVGIVVFSFKSNAKWLGRYFDIIEYSKHIYVLGSGVTHWVASVDIIIE